MYIRKWLNDDTGRAHIIIDVKNHRYYEESRYNYTTDKSTKVPGAYRRSLSADVTIADCNRTVTLDFHAGGVEGKPNSLLKSLNKRHKKLKILIDSLLKMEEIFLKEIKEVEALGKPVKKSK